MKKISIFLAVALVSLWAVMFLTIHMARKEAEDGILDDISYCIKAEGQCGLHNLIEESELEDISIEMTITHLIENDKNLSCKDRSIGLKIAEYLLKQKPEKREDLIRQASDRYGRQS